MRQHPWTIVLLALLLSACGGAATARAAGQRAYPGGFTPARLRHDGSGDDRADRSGPSHRANRRAVPRRTDRADSTSADQHTGASCIGGDCRANRGDRSQQRSRRRRKNVGQPGEPTRIVIDAVGIDQTDCLGRLG